MFGDPAFLLLRFLALLPALVVHEFAHAYSAYRLGDPTPRYDGRVTLNPLAHLDPVGTLMILLAPIGWAKPVRVNPYNFRNPAKHMMISTACGPLANIAFGTATGLALRVLLSWPRAGHLAGETVLEYLLLVVLINFYLAFFNLIPLGVLDGHEVLGYFIPYPQKLHYQEFNARYGMAVLVALIALSTLSPIDVLGQFLRPARLLVGLITGLRF